LYSQRALKECFYDYQVENEFVHAFSYPESHPVIDRQYEAFENEFKSRHVIFYPYQPKFPSSPLPLPPGFIDMASLTTDAAWNHQSVVIQKNSSRNTPVVTWLGPNAYANNWSIPISGKPSNRDVLNITHNPLHFLASTTEKYVDRIECSPLPSYDRLLGVIHD
jgi:hypothetical protein